MNKGHNEPDLPEGGIHGEGEIHPEGVRNPEVNYDRTDMSAKAIVGFLIALAIAGVFMHLSLWAVYKYLTASERAVSPLAGPIQSGTRQLPQGDPERTFPAPRLQTDDVADMNKFRISEEEMLRTYGSSNQTAGAARIPIEQAMQVIAKQGLPTRPQPPENAGMEAAQAPAPGSGGAETREETGNAAAVPASNQ
jgi:hypothetical protein